MGQGLLQKFLLRFAPCVKDVKVHQKKKSAKDPILENARMESVEHVDAEVVDACSDLDAEHSVAAMYHGMFRILPNRYDDLTFSKCMTLAIWASVPIGHLHARPRAGIRVATVAFFTLLLNVHNKKNGSVCSSIWNSGPDLA